MFVEFEGSETSVDSFSSLLQISSQIALLVMLVTGFDMEKECVE